MKKCGDQKERRAYGKNGLPVELHLVAVGFEKRRPAPAELAVRVFGHLLTGWAVIANGGEILREARAGDLERAEIELGINALQLRERIGDQVFVAQLAKLLRRH